MIQPEAAQEIAGLHTEVVPLQSTAMQQLSGTPEQDSTGASYSINGTDNAQSQSPNTDLTSHRLLHSSQGRNPRSCHTCRRRKVRCDKREGGCGNCAKAHIECFYPGPGRAPRRPKSGAPKGTTQRETELLKRLRRLEGVVEELSGQVEIEHGPRQPSGGETESPNTNNNPVRVVGMDEGMASTKAWAGRMLDIGGGPPVHQRIENEFGKLVIDEGKSAYVSNAFWARFHGEIENIREMFEEEHHASEEDDDVISSPGGSGSISAVTGDVLDHQSFVVGYSSADVDLRKLHPLPSQIPFYWETFKENVDPLCKVLHIPTMSKTMKEVQANLGSLSPSTEALCFAIYFAAIVSMETEEVQTCFGLDKSHLLKQYRFAVEQALAKASFLTTSEIVTVQALVIFLVCVRRFDDSKFVWTVTGLAIRIAQSIGLHRDGTKFNLCPFDTEMRRRCWWQLCILDVRCAEDYGSDPAIMESSYDTELPLNINDDDLDPQSLEPPKPRVGVSEMTFCMIRFEICHTSRQLSYIPPKDGPCKNAAKSRTLAEKEELVKQLHEKLELKYLVYCKDAGPLYWVAATVSRLIVAKMGLVIYSPHLHEGISQVTKDRLFISSIEIMEYSQLLKIEISTRKWGWLFHTYVQWYAIAYILGEVCTRPPSEIVDRGWRAVDAVFNDWDDLVKHSKEGMHWMPMRRLMAKARRKREADMLLSGETLFTEPSLLRESNSTDSMSLNPPTYGSYPAASPGFFDDDDRSNTLEPILKPAVEHSISMLANLPPQSQSLPQTHPHPQQPYSTQSYQQAPPSQQPATPPANRPWILDDSALVDLDMSFLDANGNPSVGPDGDLSNVDNWDELVSYFQTETDAHGVGLATGQLGDPRFNGGNGVGGFNLWY